MPVQNLGSSSSPSAQASAAPSTAPSPSSTGGDWQAQLGDFLSIYLGTKPLLHQGESFGQVALDALPQVDPNDADMQRRPYAPDLRGKGMQGARPPPPAQARVAGTSALPVQDQAKVDATRPIDPRGGTPLAGRGDVYA